MDNRIIFKLINKIKLLWIKGLYKNRITLGNNVRVNSNSKIKAKGESLDIGNNVSIETNVHIVTVLNGKLNIGNNVFINRNCIIVSRSKVYIGDGCCFGPNVCIYDHDHEFDCSGIKNTYKFGEISIGEKCWIGANTVILRGTVIGDGCVIGAGTIVKGNIPSHSIVKPSKDLIINKIVEK